MDSIIKVDEQGNLTIPQSIITSSGFTESPLEFCLIPIEDGFILKASLTAQEKRLLADFDAKILPQLGDVTKDTPVFGNLTADEYLSLSEVAQDKLWDSAFEEAYQELDDAEEWNSLS
jgi:hypothetical protein